LASTGEAENKEIRKVHDRGMHHKMKKCECPSKKYIDMMNVLVDKATKCKWLGKSTQKSLERKYGFKKI